MGRAPAGWVTKSPRSTPLRSVAMAVVRRDAFHLRPIHFGKLEARTPRCAPAAPRHRSAVASLRCRHRAGPRDRCRESGCSPPACARPIRIELAHDAKRLVEGNQHVARDCAKWWARTIVYGRRTTRVRTIRTAAAFRCRSSEADMNTRRSTFLGLLAALAVGTPTLVVPTLANAQTSGPTLEQRLQRVEAELAISRILVEYSGAAGRPGLRRLVPRCSRKTANGSTARTSTKVAKRSSRC